MKAIIFDIDGTLLESMVVNTKLYFSAVTKVLGPISIRKLGDYDHVTDSGILAQILDDNGYSASAEVTTSVKAIFLKELRRHIENVGSFPVIDGALEFVESVRKWERLPGAIVEGIAARCRLYGSMSLKSGR